MKRFLPSALSAAVLALGVSSVAPAWAENLTYPGAALLTVNGVTDSLAPTGSDGGQSASLTGNAVNINAPGVVNGSVYGAVNLNDGTAVTGNTVNINGGTVDTNAYGAYAAQSADGGTATASYNIVNVGTGSTVSGNVFGGYALAGSYTGSDGTAIASNNTVTISGTVNGAGICGGNATVNSTGTGTVTANYNTVTINGTAVLSNSAYLFGACTGVTGSVILTPPTGNTLNLHQSGLNVAGVNYFQNLNFYLPATLTSGGTMLTATAAFDDDNAQVTVALDPANPAVLQTGDEFTLIDASSVTGEPLSTLQFPATGTLGGYTYTLALDGNTLVLKIGGKAPISASNNPIPALNPAALGLLALLLAAAALLGARMSRRKD